MKVFLMVLSVLLLVVSCKRARFEQLEESSVATETDVAEPTGPHILFLFMKAQKTESGEVLTIESHRKVEGVLKGFSGYKTRLTTGLRYIFFDAAKERTDTFWQEHPLHKHIEVADQDGRLQSRTIDLEEAEVSLRITGQSWYAMLVVEALHENEPIQILTSKPYQL